MSDAIYYREGLDCGDPEWMEIISWKTICGKGVTSLAMAKKLAKRYQPQNCRIAIRHNDLTEYLIVVAKMHDESTRWEQCFDLVAQRNEDGEWEKSTTGEVIELGECL